MFAFFPFLYAQEPFPLWLICAALSVRVFCVASGAVCAAYGALKMRYELYDENLVIYLGLLEKKKEIFLGSIQAATVEDSKALGVGWEMRLSWPGILVLRLFHPELG